MRDLWAVSCYGALVLNLFGCSADAPENPLAVNPGSMGDPGAGGAVNNDVTGVSVTTYLLEAGPMMVPDDLTKVAISALVPDDHGGFTPIAGQGNADGTFTIPNVPMRTYYLKIGSAPASEYVITAARTLDLGGTTLGRPDVVNTGQSPTTFSPMLSGLSPWGSNDSIQMFSANAGAFSSDISDQARPPRTGATTASGTKLVYKDYFAVPNLIDSSKGDQAFIYQLAAQKSPSLGPYTAISGSVVPSALTVKYGLDTPITGSLTAVPQDSFSAHLAFSQFEKLAAAGHAKAMVGETSFYLEAQPGGLDYGDFSVSPDLLSYSVAPGKPDTDTGALRYGNPFPASWGTYGYAESTFSVSYLVPSTVPGVMMPLSVSGSAFYAADAKTMAASGIQPPVGTVSNVKFNGNSAAVDLTGITPTPTLTFDPPGVGTATSYVVTLLAVQVKSGMAPTVITAATFHTQDTTLQVPPGILVSGSSYICKILAVNSSMDSLAAPNRIHLPNGGAEVLSGLLQH